MPSSLAELDNMSLSEAQSLPFQGRDELLNLIIQDGRKQASPVTSFRTGLYCDYFEEDMTRMLKVKAVKVRCRGVTAADFKGEMSFQGLVDEYRTCFRNVESILKNAGTDFSRVVTLVIFLTDMSQWETMNTVYLEFIPHPPCRAAIGTTALALKGLNIEIVDCVAYKVLP